MLYAFLTIYYYKLVEMIFAFNNLDIRLHVSSTRVSLKPIFIHFFPTFFFFFFFFYILNLNHQ
jgi:hypothetical protein